MVYSTGSHDYLKVVCWIGWPIGAVSSLCVQSGMRVTFSFGLIVSYRGLRLCVIFCSCNMTFWISDFPLWLCGLTLWLCGLTLSLSDPCLFLTMQSGFVVLWSNIVVVWFGLQSCGCVITSPCCGMLKHCVIQLCGSVILHSGCVIQLCGCVILHCGCVTYQGSNGVVFWVVCVISTGCYCRLFKRIVESCGSLAWEWISILRSNVCLADSVLTFTITPVSGEIVFLHSP